MGALSGGSGSWFGASVWAADSGGMVHQAWVDGSDAYIQGAPGTITIGAPVSARSLNFATTGFTIAGTSTLTLATSGVVDVGTGTATINRPIAGTVGLSKNGAGTLTLTAANTYTGPTSIVGGTLRVSGSLAAGTSVTINSTGTLAMDGGTIGGPLSQVINGKIELGTGLITDFAIPADFTWNGSNDGSATLRYDLDASNISDRILITGSLIKGSGTTYKFDFGGTGTAGTYTLVQVTGSQNFSASDLSYVNLGGGFGATFDVSDPKKIKLLVGVDGAPTVTISDPSQTAATSGPVSYTITYADGNFNQSTLSTSDIIVNTTGTAAVGSFDVDSGTGTTRTVTLFNLTGDGTIGISLAAGTASDTTGHSAAAAGPSATFTVANSVPKITSDGAATGTYLGTFEYTVTTDTPGATLNATGLPPNLTFDPATGIISGTLTKAGVFGITLTATNTAGTVGTKNLSLTIPKKSITISGITVIPRQADGTLTAALNFSNVILSGVFASDIPDVQLNTSGVTAAFSDPNPGFGKPVIVTGLGLTGAAAGNYLITQPVVTGTILGQTATIIFGNLNQTYNGQPKPVNVSTDPAGLSLTVTYNGSTTIPTNAGSYNVVATISSTVYFGSSNATLTVAKATQTVSFGALGDRLISDGSFNLSATASSGLPVSFSVAGPATLTGTTVVPTGGEGTVTITASQPGDINYAAAPDVVRSFVISNRPAPGLYIGSFAGDRADAAFGFVLRADNSGTFACFLPTLNIGFIKPVTVDASGAFSTSFLPLGSTITVTLRGHISGGVISGNLDPFAISFNGSYAGASTTLDTGSQPSVAAAIRENAAGAGSTLAAGAPVSGLYQVVAVGTAGTTTVTVFAGADGRAYVFTTDGTRASGAATTISNAGVLSVTLPDQSRVALTFAADGTATGTLTPTSGVATTITGGAEAVASTQRMLNMSARGRTGSGDAVLIAGFVINGASPKRVVVRVAGPILTNFGVNNVLANPNLTIKNSAGTVVATNDDWGAQNPANPDIAVQMLQAGGFPFGAASKDAAIVLRLAPGPYTVLAGGGDGTVLTEVYELLDTGEAPAAKKIVNFSARGQVGVANEPLTAGFVIAGNVPKRVLIRGIGPTIASVLPGAIANPRVRVFDSNSTKLAENDDWFRDANATQISAAAASVGAFPLGAQGLDAALLIVLQPGAYTAVVDDASGGTGLGLVEVYEVP